MEFAEDLRVQTSLIYQTAQDKVQSNLEIIEEEFKELERLDSQEFNQHLRHNSFGISVAEDMDEQTDKNTLSQLFKSFGLSEPLLYRDGIMLSIELSSLAMLQVFKVFKYVKLPHINFFNVDAGFGSPTAQEPEINPVELYSHIPFAASRMFNELLDSTPDDSDVPI